MKFHEMQSPAGLMQALQCGFALGYPSEVMNRWFWMRVSPDSDTWEIEFGGWGSSWGLGPFMEILVCKPWRWHIGLVEDGPDGSRGDFEVVHEDTLPWILK